jgi:hypothetical protein
MKNIYKKINDNNKNKNENEKNYVQIKESPY